MMKYLDIRNSLLDIGCSIYPVAELLLPTLFLALCKQPLMEIQSLL